MIGAGAPPSTHSGGTIVRALGRTLTVGFTGTDSPKRPEAEIAAKFVEAARVYENHPTALQLRAMNIIYETTKERGATILIPSAMVDSLNPTLARAVAGQNLAGDAMSPLKTAA